MKKGYLLLPAFLIGTAFAQQNPEGPSVQNEKQVLMNSEYMPRAYSNSGMRAPGDPIYTETFADPFNNGWTTSGTGSSGGTYPPNQLWLHDTDGPNGYFSDPSEIITSTTAGDGFLMLDGDFFNGNGGPPSNVESYHAEAVSPVYDLSAFASSNTHVSISFEHAYRNCCSSAEPQLWVEISTDGFNNVAASYDVSYPDAPINIASGTRMHYINITNDISGNPANVQIRFRWGTAGSSNNASHYFWQVDDLTVYETHNFHGTMDSLAYFADIDNFDGRYTSGEDYADGFQKIPSYAAGNTTLSFRAYLSNTGALDWTNAALQVDQDGSSFATSQTVNVNTFSQSDSLIAEAIMPTAVATYNYTAYGVVQGTFDIMDTTSLSIEVTADAYSTAGSTPTGRISIQDWNWNTTPQSGGCGGEFIATAGANDTIRGMRVRVVDTTYNEFVPIEAAVYVNGTLATTSETFTIDPNYFGQYQELAFTNEVIFADGDTITYYIISDYEADPNHSLDFLASGSAAYHFVL